MSEKRTEDLSREADVDDSHLARVVRGPGAAKPSLGATNVAVARARTATPRGLPVSASMPEGRSRARIGLPERFIASTTERSTPSTGSGQAGPEQAVDQPVGAGDEGIELAAGEGVGGWASCQAIWPTPASCEDLPLGLGIAPELFPAREPDDPDREPPGVQVPRDHAAVAPVVPRPAEHEHLGAGTGGVRPRDAAA